MSESPPDNGPGPASPGTQAVPVAGAGAGSDTTMSFGAVPPSEQDIAEPAFTDSAAIGNLPSGSALLVVRRGPNTGSRFLLDQDRVTAGRHPGSDIFLDDVTVSRKHAEFLRREGRFVVRDIGSLNGTYVRRERIDEAVLQDGDEVQIGKFRMTFHPGPQQAGAGAGR